MAADPLAVGHLGAAAQHQRVPKAAALGRPGPVAMPPFRWRQGAGNAAMAAQFATGNPAPRGILTPDFVAELGAVAGNAAVVQALTSLQPLPASIQSGSDLQRVKQIE